MRASVAADSSLPSRWVTGVVTVFFGASAALVSGLVLAAGTGWPLLAVVASAVAFGALVAALAVVVGSGPVRGWSAIAGRAAIAVAVGVVVGELATMSLFTGAVDRGLDTSAAKSAEAAPAVVQASADLAQSRATRAELDLVVDRSRARLDEALVVARCEYNPSPGCPMTRITGAPGRGPETLTANELLADARQELDTSLATREARASELDAAVFDDERVLGDARTTAMADADRGIGARWVAMHDHTLSDPASMLLRVVAIAFFVLLSLLPLILTLLRGPSMRDLRAASHAERELAELEADTAIAVKRAEVRQAAEILRAEQQLASARLALDAQHQIDSALHRHRIAQALEGGHTEVDEPQQMVGEAAEQKQLASASTPVLPARPEERLPAPRGSEVIKSDGPKLIPSLPDLTASAARWVRPLVPTIVAKAIDSTVHPVRTARQVFEEVEEIHLSLRRTHKLTVHSVDSPDPLRETQPADAPAGAVAGRIVGDALANHDPAGAVAGRAGNIPLGVGASNGRELPEGDGVRQLPPGD